MSRIRSVHPGLFTDEAFMAASPHARVLLIGLWCEADDQGVFEWKVLTLKARILPADSVDVGALLHELSAIGTVQSFEQSGKTYGAIRNFRRYQRPQRPNAMHPLPERLRSFVGLSATEGGSDSPDSASAHGKSPQMEEEGGRREKTQHPDQPLSQTEPHHAADPPLGVQKGEKYAFIGKAIRLTEQDFSTWNEAYDRLDLRAELVALDAWIASESEEKRKRWFGVVSGALAKKQREAKAGAQAAAARAAPNGSGVSAKDREHQRMLQGWRDHDVWNRTHFGPPPGDPSCVLDHFLTEADRALAQQRKAGRAA